MKKTRILYVVLLFVLTASAQEYTHSLQDVEWVKIESRTDVIVKTHSNNELHITGGIKYQVPERAKGLKLVGEEGKDNTDVGFYVIKEGSTLIVKNLRRSKKAEIYLPASQNISVTTNWNGGIKIDGFKGEVEANSRLNGSVVIENVSGPLTANSLNGQIDVVFSKVSQESPITIYSTNGALDIAMQGNTPADLVLSSINGAIYTDFELKLPEKKGLKPIAAKKVKGVINNGGVDIRLSTTNGNIYLRKQ